MIDSVRITAVLLFSLALALQPMSSALGSTFDDTIAPLLSKYCLDCHGADEPGAGFHLDNIGPPEAGSADLARWDKVLEMVSIGDMPPKEAEQLSRQERRQLVTWVESEFRKLGLGPDPLELAFPKYANRVNHDELFSGEHRGPAFTSSRVWRMSPHIYEQLLQDLTLNEFNTPLTAMSGDGFDDYAVLYADEATISTMLQNAKRTAMNMVHGQLVKPRGAAERNPENKPYRKGTRHRPLADFAQLSEPPTDAQMAEVVAYTFRTLLQREPTEAEAKRYVESNLKPNIEAGGNDAGLRGFLVSVLLSPEFLFRMEMGLGERLDDGRRMLSPHELAYALSFALYDRPIDRLIEVADKGRLRTRDDVERELRALLDSASEFRGQIPVSRRNNAVWPVGKLGMKEVDKPRMLRFFQEFFGYTHAVDVFKDDIRHGGAHRPRQIVLDADWFVLSVLAKDQHVLETLLTSNEYLISYRSGRNTSSPEAYNLTKEEWSRESAVSMPPEQRAGMLTHPAWLVAHSGNFENDPVRRGKWIQERLLAGVVPDIPIGVEAQLPEAPHATLRERFEIVKAEECWRCHKKMNPLGDPFEMFDDFGRFRERHHVSEEGHVLASELEVNRQNRNLAAKLGPTVATTGQLSGTGDATLDGEVSNAVELVQRLAKSRRVRQSFLRHMFRYWMGRNETLNDSPTLVAMETAYVESNGSFKESLVALLTSDSFLYRK